MSTTLHVKKNFEKKKNKKKETKKKSVKIGIKIGKFTRISIVYFMFFFVGVGRRKLLLKVLATTAAAFLTRLFDLIYFMYYRMSELPKSEYRRQKDNLPGWLGM